MSGHSKWSTIKRKKGAIDAKRGKIFTKLIREIQIAARMGGADASGNPRLRDAITEARANNMPRDNIERAVKRGSGEDGDGVVYEQITYEGYGPGGVAMLIEILTDNRNRTAAEVRALMARNSGNMADVGSVAWMFGKKGVITLKKNAAPEDKLMDIALEAGADDIKDEGDCWEILTEPMRMGRVREAIEGKGITVDSSTVTAIPQNSIPLSGDDAERMLKLMDLLEDLDDVQKVYANFDIDDKELERLGY